MAASYAALLFLARSLQQILNLEHRILLHPIHKEKVVSLREKVEFIVTFLEDYSDKYGRALALVENGIREAVYEAQDFMDSYLCSVSTTKDDGSSCSETKCDQVSLDDQDLNAAYERIDFVWKVSMKMKMKKNDAAEDLRPKAYSCPLDLPSTIKISTTENIIVGFDDDLLTIKEQLYDDSTGLQVIPIVGMGGIGKTTLARRAYEDSLIAQYFDFCKWVTVSSQEYERRENLLEYERREILLGLLKSFKNPNDKDSEAQLATLVYQSLVGRRYLIVIDDIWTTETWDDLKSIFPDEYNGSRILLTTRLSYVAVHASSALPHQMNLLNEDQSWRLLQKRVFGQESCPLKLVKIGKKIARNCRGLPLTIVVVAGLLLSLGDIAIEEIWENISNNINSAEPTIAQHCLKTLSLSYDRLPLQLKPCFLYFAAFPEDYEIDVSKLIMLWVSEGFLKPRDQSMCLEDVGEWYLQDLVNRSLISVSKREPHKKLERVGIHDMLREICVTKAKEEGFLHHVSQKYHDVMSPNRRVSICCTQTIQESQIQNSRARSILLYSERNLESRLHPCCRRLNVLDAPNITLQKFSEAIPAFLYLRYVSFAFNATSCPYGFPLSLCKLPYLETIIMHKTDFTRFQVPCEILEMPNLRHLVMDTSFDLPYCPDRRVTRESEIQTLYTVINFVFSEEIIKILVNLKRLRLFIPKYHDSGDYLNLNNLFRLQKLEELQVVFYLPSPTTKWKHSFPISLKKLTLRKIPLLWEHMCIIGSLPNLEVLEMMFIDLDRVSVWRPIEGQFLQLKYFYSSLDYLVMWDVEKEHFPRLESLILWRAMWINEIPCGIGEIDSLQLIELQHCGKSLVDSAKRIQEQHSENGNDSFVVRLVDCAK